jgi:serine/threonine protein kinase
VEHLGRYRIDAVLGEGRVGRVHRAFDEQRARPVALKLLVRAGDERARMLAEARAGMALDHPDIVTIHDVGEIDGHAYLAMELIDGRPLRQFVGDGSVPLAVRIGWLTTVARALAAGHARGLVHRGVRPENIFVRPDGGLKLLEFGMALVAHADPLGPVGQFEATAPGASLDTPLFLAPEQIRKQPSDARADQFAWAVVAHELLAGVHPWAARDPIALVASILSRPARPLHELVPDLPRAFGHAVDRALRKDPAERFATMTDLLASLDAPAPARARLLGLMAATARSDGAVTQTPDGLRTTRLVTPTERPQWPWIAGIVVAAAIVGAALAAAL